MDGGAGVSARFLAALVANGDGEMIGELTIAALRAAIRQSREAAVKEMGAAAGGLDLSGVMDMLGK